MTEELPPSAADVRSPASTSSSVDMIPPRSPRRNG
jgi:hypothetical protein